MTEDLKNEARAIALTLSPQDAKALVDGKRLMLRSADKPTLEVRLGTPLGDMVARLVADDVAPKGYTISSLVVGNRGPLWQAQLDVEHPLVDNSEHGAIMACRRHRALVQIEALLKLQQVIEAKAEASWDDSLRLAYDNVIEEIEQQIAAFEALA